MAGVTAVRAGQADLLAQAAAGVQAAMRVMVVLVGLLDNQAALAPEVVVVVGVLGVQVTLVPVVGAWVY